MQAVISFHMVIVTFSGVLYDTLTHYDCGYKCFIVYSELIIIVHHHTIFLLVYLVNL